MGLFSPPKLRIVHARQTAPAIETAPMPEWRSRWSYDDGSKWQGAFGPTSVLRTDYWTLRLRSVELFETNLYARGLLRRLVTNEINTGLHLEAIPEEKILGLEEDSLSEWSENVENRWSIWTNEPRLCDQQEQRTFGALQAIAKLEAYIAGDVLCVNRQDQRTGLPKIQLVSGSCVRTPMQAPQSGNRIEEGVELDSMGRHVAYWIVQRNPTGLGLPVHKRLPAYGEKSGRRLAWLVYGGDRKLEDVRGKPFLSLILQSVKELDRYRDSTQRKALINSILAMFISKGEDKPGTRPLTGSAIRRGAETAIANDGTARSFKAAEQIPGLVLEELQHGEEPKAFPNNGTDERFGGFEMAIVSLIAWGNEIPPEILTLSFNSNYSASQAAINEFKMTLNMKRTEFGDCFCTPIYRDWLLAEVLAKRVEAAGLLDAWRDPSKYDLFGAWMASDWSGHIKPAVDLSKLVGGYVAMLDRGLITYGRAARELTGTRFSKNAQQMARETRLLFEAVKPISELKALEKAQAPEPKQDSPNDERPPADDPINEESDTAALARRALRPIAVGAAANAD